MTRPTRHRISGRRVPRPALAVVAIAAAGALGLAPFAAGARPTATETAKTPVPTVPPSEPTDTTGGDGPVPTPPPITPTTAPPPTTGPGGDPFTTPPVTAAPVTTPPPGGGTELTDSSRRIQVTVPAEWTDTNLGGARRDDGGRRPVIHASTDRSSWRSDWTLPGVWIAALPPTTEPATAAEAFTWSRTCTANPAEPYNDGRHVGELHRWTNCGGGTTQVLALGAQPFDGTYTLYVNLQTPTADDPAIAMVLGSVGAVPGANPGEVSAPLPQPPTLGPMPAHLAQPVAAPDATSITDESGHLTASVPNGWTDVNDRSSDHDDLSPRAHLSASPSLDGFFGDWTTPGVDIIAFPYRADSYTLLSNLGYGGNCTDGGLHDVHVRDLVGLMQTWSDCGSTTSRIIALAVAPPDLSSTVYIEIQLPTADDADLATVLATLVVTPAIAA